MLRWLATELQTGRVVLDLPRLNVDDPYLQQTLNTYDTATAHLPILPNMKDWERAVLEGGTVLACYDSQDPQRTPLWGGYIVEATDIAATNTVDLSLATLDAYFDRRDVGDLTLSAGQHRDDIIAQVLTDYVKTTRTDPGIDNLQLAYTPGGGPALTDDRTWENSDNASALERIQELRAEFGGEFTVTWSWAADGQHLVPTVRFGDRIGATVKTPKPAVTFRYPGRLVIDARRGRSYAEGKGANRITLYSSGQGSVTPYADPVRIAARTGRPTFDFRWAPRDSETDTAVLYRLAQNAGSVLGPGARPVALTLSTSAMQSTPGYRYGEDWGIGDTVGYDIRARVFPDGITGTGRIIGVQISRDTVRPVFADTDTYGLSV